MDRWHVEAEVEVGVWQVVARELPKREANRIVRDLRERRLHPLRARLIRAT